MTEFISFFLIISAALLFSEFFNRLHLPWVTALIVSGIVFGADGLGWIVSNDITDFFAEVGLVFLMFMAGLEINFKSFKNVRKEVATISIVNGLAPFLLALIIGAFFGLSARAGFLLAAALVSSSIAVVLPSLEGMDVFRRKVGQTIIASTVLLDIVSVTLFSIFIQQATETTLPLPVLYVSLAMALVLLRLAVPRLEAYLARSGRHKFEQELQSIISVLIGVVVLFGLLGLQPAEAGFFAGLVLSDSINSQVARSKLHAIAYGLFIPVFFVMVGVSLNLDTFLRGSTVIGLTLAVVLGSMAIKFISGWLGGRVSRFSPRESALIGAATIPQLNVTLAVAATGFAYGLIGQELLAALIMLSVVTSLVAPPLMAKIARTLPNV